MKNKELNSVFMFSVLFLIFLIASPKPLEPAIYASGDKELGTLMGLLSFLWFGLIWYYWGKYKQLKSLTVT